MGYSGSLSLWMELWFWDPDPPLCPTWPLPHNMKKCQRVWFLVKRYGLQSRFCKNGHFQGFQNQQNSTLKNGHKMAKFEHFWLKFWYVVLCSRFEGMIKKFFSKSKIFNLSFFSTSKTGFGLFPPPPCTFFQIRGTNGKSRTREIQKYGI